MTVSTGAAVGIAMGSLIAGILICGLVVDLLGGHRYILKKRPARGADGEDGNLEESIFGEKASRSHRGGPIDPERILSTPEQQQNSPVSSLDSSSSSIATIETLDQEVRQEFVNLNIAIKGHAELYYNLRPIEDEVALKSASCDTNLSTLDDLLGPTAPLDAIAMDSLLQTPETRHEGIRLLIAWSLFRFIQLDAPVERTLLPPELVQCAQAMSRHRQDVSSGTMMTTMMMMDEEAKKKRLEITRKPLPLNSNPGSGASNRVISSPPLPHGTSTATTTSAPTNAAALQEEPDNRILFAKWREISGKLFPPIHAPPHHNLSSSPPFSSSSPPHSSSSAAAAAAAAANANPHPHPLTTPPNETTTTTTPHEDLITTLVCLLQPYIATGYGGARVRDLENVVAATTRFGFRLMFTSRTEWEFAWSTLMADEFVVFPALVKVGDGRG